MKEHGVYKFVEKETKTIVYIGKTNSSFKQRIDAHIRATGSDAKFKPYANKCDVFIAELPNVVETDVMERILINKYKPILNVIDNTEGYSGLIVCNEPKWNKYGIRQKKQKKCADKKNSETDITKYIHMREIGERYGDKVYLWDGKSDFQIFKTDKEALCFCKEVLDISQYGSLHNGFIRVKGEYLNSFRLVNRVIHHGWARCNLCLSTAGIPFWIFGNIEYIDKWNDTIKEFDLYPQGINVLRKVFK